MKIDLDGIDSRANEGVIFDKHEITALTRLVRELDDTVRRLRRENHELKKNRAGVGLFETR